MNKNKITIKKAKALIALIDDQDTNVYEAVKAELLNADFKVITELQKAFLSAENELKSERLVEILDQLKFEKLTSDIASWRQNKTPDLLEGMLHIARYGYPDLNLKTIESVIREMSEAIKPQLANKSPEEIATVFNQVILNDFKFRGNINEYAALNNSFINKTIETRATNPIGLSVLYLLVAKAVNIPLVGINSPGHFVLGYYMPKDDKNEKAITINQISFFINPFNNGDTIKSTDFKNWLKLQLNSETKLDAVIADNKAIIKRVFNNMIYALFTSGERNTAERLLTVAETI